MISEYNLQSLVLRDDLPDDLLDKDISYFGFKGRTYNILKRNGYHTIRTFKDKTFAEICSLPGAGTTTKKDLVNHLSKFSADPIDYVGDKSADSLLNVLNPKTKEHYYLCKIKTKHNVYVLNAPLSDLSISAKILVPIKSILIRNGLPLDFKSLLSVSCSEFTNRLGFGEGKMTSLITYLRDNTVFEISEEKRGTHSDILDVCADVLYEDIVEQHNVCISYDTIKSIVYSNADVFVKHLDKYSQTHRYDKILYDENICNPIYGFLDNYFYDFMKSVIISNQGIDKKDLISLMPVSYSRYWNSEGYFMDFLRNKDISLYADKLYCDGYSFDDYFASLGDFPNKDIITDRLSGKVLEEIGKKYGKTRERIRQIVLKFINDVPATSDDKYLYWLSRYDISERAFTDIFKASPMTYYYLKLKLNHHEGSKPLDYMVDDECFYEIFFSAKDVLQKYFGGKGVIKVYGKFVPLVRRDIVERIVEVHFSDKAGSVDEIRKIYMKFCKENNLDDFLKSANNVESFNKIIGDKCYKHVILSDWDETSYYRYYIFDDVYNVSDFIKAMNFDKYMDKVISTSKLFNDHIDIMKKYDVRNPRELHNIFRKYSEHLPKYVNCIRSPHIEIGCVNRKQQIDDVIDKYQPKTNTELASIFENLYGVNTGVFLASWVNDAKDF